MLESETLRQPSGFAAAGVYLIKTFLVLGSVPLPILGKPSFAHTEPVGPSGLDLLSSSTGHRAQAPTPCVQSVAVNTTDA